MALVRAQMPDMRRGQTALAHHMAAYLRLQVIRQQNLREAHRVELAPVSLATWNTFLQLRSIPCLRMEAGFPCTLRWLEAMCDQSVQIIGQTCMAEHMNASLGLTVTDRSDAAQDRTAIIVELNALPTCGKVEPSNFLQLCGWSLRGTSTPPARCFGRSRR